MIWMNDEPLLPGRSYFIRIGTKTVPATITTIKHKIDVNTRDHLAATTLHLNDIAFCNISTSVPVAFDPYAENRKTGSFIVIDRFKNQTVGAGMVDFGLRRGTNIHWQPLLIGKAERAGLKQQKPVILWFTGLSGSGKSTIANIVEQTLNLTSHHTMLLDGDNVRHGLNRDLGFTEVDRVENIRRVGEVAKLMTESGLIVLCSFISPYRADRQMVRSLVERIGIPGSLRRYAGGGLHQARSEGPLCQGQGRPAEELHRHRCALRGARAAGDSPQDHRPDPGAARQSHSRLSARAQDSSGCRASRYPSRPSGSAARISSAAAGLNSPSLVG